jgi:hypothetical protein
MKRYSILTLVFLIFLGACQKEDNNQTNTAKETVNEYMPLAVGNYWVYQHSLCDSGEVNCEAVVTDTNKVIKDTMIRGHLYYRIDGWFLQRKSTYFVRDSLDYLVDSSGTVIFTHTDTSSIFNQEIIKTDDGDTLYRWHYRLASELIGVEVAAGAFDCLDMRGHFTRLKEEHKIDHNMHKYYAKDVGVVKQTNFFASNLKVVKQELKGNLTVESFPENHFSRITKALAISLTCEMVRCISLTF